MKINNDCARRILLEVEKIPCSETMTVAKLQEIIFDFSIEDVLGIITLYNRDRYLRVADKVSYDDTDVLRDNKIRCLTEKGYKALDLIRDDNTWNTIKDKLPNFNELSIYTIIDLADKISNNKQNELFDLPRDLIIFR